MIKIRQEILLILLMVISSFLVADSNSFEDPQKAFEENSLKQQFIYDEKLNCLEIKETVLKIEDEKKRIQTEENSNFFNWEIIELMRMPSAVLNGNEIEELENRLKNLYRLENEKCD